MRRHIFAPRWTTLSRNVAVASPVDVDVTLFGSARGEFRRLVADRWPHSGRLSSSAGERGSGEVETERARAVEA